jgi:hypothetical protein
MCRAVRYQFEGEEYEPYFTSPLARLPVRMKNGQQLLVPWGRRPREQCTSPFGPGIRLSAIQSGLWDHLIPKPVKIVVQHFMESDVTGKPHWFQVTAGQYLQGMLIQQKQGYRVYIVQLDCNSSDICFEQWPRIVSAPF